MYEILLNPHNIPEKEYKTYRQREAARGIVTNGKNEIGTVYVGLYDYYKLPGGGIKEGETPEQAMQRECIEELGCHVTKLNTLPIKIIEVKTEFRILQINHILSCIADKFIGQRDLSDYEKTLKFQVKWQEYQNCINSFVSKHPTGGEDSHYITVRDTMIISTYQKLQSF